MKSTTRTAPRQLLFPASALIALCAFLHACGGGGSSGGGGSPPPNPAPPPTSFVSTSVFPANSATSVQLLPTVLVSFNDNINPATATAANVFLTQGAAVVPSTVSPVACILNQVQLIPDAPLSPSTVYTINLASGLQDDDGQSVTAITYSFTTGAFNDVVRPTFTVAGFAGVPNPGDQESQVLLTWNPGDDGANPAGTISYRVYVSTQPPCFNYAVPAGPPTAQGAQQAIVTGLSPRTVYSFVVRAVDAQGNESNNVNMVNVTTFTSYIANVYPVVQQFCVACHTPPTGQALNPPTNPIITMDYTNPATVYTSWVGMTPSWPQAANAGMLRVVAGNPANSFLWNKINSATPVAGVQMPFGQAPLSAANQDIIFDWITEGALDN